ncbi:hypothetical protein [Streptomyces hydrogenans]|uniref:Single-stranded DNA-binding protein n=1 Tax=Streptomyces hydrogenans TaxID=1873719 RepID=A0ABQ3PCJ2_9ACTN|nr:hypothetical protein [Streptomyces hydrogenans]GHE26006.1 hypothetical protein GCM10018784_75090 [Streptomyces hydrogenans]GHI20432.1 hypothetical protein Shyd_18030 [Streptomyces hydrogenans]GHI22713.1 hypothetical protein Shyd_40840 [Streptomyces hydrogenans]GHI24182.1 hypothetical protein Shyd_55530 [Streptomyces hydrogenans]GHI25870.1 hypothetical protein Shyd_72410 [Streptomyces hydrogenans]
MTVRKSHGGVAERDWFVRARVRVRAEHHARSLEQELRVFRAGEVVEMVQWGRAGQEIDTGSWWTTNQYIPAAHIVPTDKVEVLEVLEEQRPTFEGEE